MEVTIGYARANMKKLLKAVASGERVTIMNRRKPVADFVPSQPQIKERKFGAWTHQVLLDPHALDAMTAEQTERFLETGQY
jgi:antitoxin (DNA-binding transcriptional repressor) of toxin-antitoxin stability system